jgi:hypothetical protein
VLRRKLIVLLAVCLALVVAAEAGAAPTLSVSDRLEDRRYVAAGERARTLGFEAGRFYTNG